MKNNILFCNVKVDVIKKEDFESLVFLIFRNKLNFSSKLKSAFSHRISFLVQKMYFYYMNYFMSSLADYCIFNIFKSLIAQ